MRKIAILLLVLLLAQLAQAQYASIYRLDDSNNGLQVDISDNGLILTDDNALSGNYTTATDRSITLHLQNPCPSPLALALTFSDFDIAPTDTLYFYDGSSTAAPILLKANNSVNYLLGSRNKVFISPTNTSGCITLRLVAAAGSFSGRGFVCTTDCEMPCENSAAIIDSIYQRARGGVVYQTSRVKRVTETNGQSFDCINLCYGDELLLTGHGSYGSNHGYYTAADSNSTFRWNLGIDHLPPDGIDTISQHGQASLRTDAYSDTVGCFDIILSLTDVFGCRSASQSSVRVRIAKSPIKTIVSSLPTFCNSDSLRIVIGNDVSGLRSHLVLDTLQQSDHVSHTNYVKTFIPDGPNCDVLCYSAPVNFTEFPIGMQVNSKDDICSICVNFEHSYMGDYSLRLRCPNGQSATLKYYEDEEGDLPDGAYGGGDMYTGYPYGGDDHDIWDAEEEDTYCDSVFNMYGIGLDYCFSRNGDYRLVDGRRADVATNGRHYLASEGYMTTVTVTFPSRPSAFRYSGNNDAGSRTFTTKRPSNYEEKRDYYKPADDFSSLIGCPLNGTWNIELCDELALDNGWVFNWSMDICDVMDTRDCVYEVGIDSVVWSIDPANTRVENGRYYGPYTHQHNDSITYLLMADTAGDFRLNVHVYDDFGCQWDSSTAFSAIWAPKPNLGPDQYLCKGATTLLQFSDPHLNPTYTYEWSPSGETTPSITSQPAGTTGEADTYILTVINNQDSTVADCKGSDTLSVALLEQPLPNIEASIYPMEGCEPLEEHFVNHSQNVDQHYWIFGDGTTSTDPEPTHSFAAGTWDIRYYVTNSNGCSDSIILSDVVSVYPSPHASFGWEPLYPHVSNPSITMHSASDGTDESTHYVWDFQTDKNNPLSFTTMEEENPTYTWNLGDEPEGGQYVVRLTTVNSNVAPSGATIECSDTAEQAIIVINDFLQFPSLVTPNGDGVNDRFVIKGLVNGWCYPINTLDIYNRWGMRIYHAENIKEDTQFWDPASTHSPTGTYYYHFVARGLVGNIERNGAIEVIRK